MNKKIIIPLIIILLLATGGIFLWWQDQKEVREFNKNLPEGVKVVKSLFGKEYKVVNKKDGYEFKVPEEWKGIDKIDYIPETTEEKYTVASINVKGLQGEARFIAVDQFKVEDGLNLESWAEKIFDDYELSGEFTQDTIENIDVVKAQENIHLAGMYVYFFKKNSAIYAITCGSEEFIRDIILNGKW